MEIWVPFRKACLGGEGEVLIGERIVRVEIPSGTEDGQPMEVDGVQFSIRVENDPQMWRDGLDLHQSITVDRYQAKEGTEVTIRILDGYMKVTVPEGIQTGQKLRLKGRGICKAGEEPGHMYLTVAITGTDVGRARVRKINLGSGND
jgi:DnaJ-class molecular chaperone